MNKDFYVKDIQIKRASFDVVIKDQTYSKGLHVLLGPNGSGKSSYLTGVTGYDPRSIKNRVLYFGQNPLDQTVEIVSYLPQHNPVFQIPVNDFIKLTANNGHLLDIEERLKYYELDQYKTQTVDRLSGGEFKRVLCAQIEMENKPVILMDEVEQGLDVNYQHLILGRLKALSKDKIILLAMHDLSLALTYADTVTTIKKGTMVNARVPNHEVTSDMLSEVFSREMTIVRQNQRVAIFT